MILKYCKGLKFEEDPNYELIKQHIATMITKNNIEVDNVFDWNSRAAAMERKSSFLHLSQHQLALKKTIEGSKDIEEKYDA